MSEFEYLQQQARARQQAAAAERHAQSAESSRQYTERVAHLGRRPHGTDPSIVLGEKASLVLSFMETMAAAGLPGSSEIVKEYATTSKRKPFWAALLGDSPKPVLLRGYMIGTDSDQPIYICEDNRLRLRNGSSLSSEDFRSGYYDWRSRIIDGPEYTAPRECGGYQFIPMPIEDTLLAIAAKHLPDQPAQA